MPRIGLIVPPATGWEPEEGPRLYPGIEFVVRGLGLPELSTLGFEAIIERVAGEARALGEAGTAAISLMGTSLSFYRGVEAHDALLATVTEASGVPATTMSVAVTDGLRALGIRRVALATAYDDDINARLRVFLERRGFEPAGLAALALRDIGAVLDTAGDRIVDLACKAVDEDTAVDGVLISCGGLRTLDIVARIEDRLGLPVVSSSPAGFWDVVQLAGGDPRVPGYGRLFGTLRHAEAA